MLVSSYNLSGFGDPQKRCRPCGLSRENQLEGYGASAAAATSGSVAAGGSTFRSIGLGVATGLTVWILTRILDRAVFKRRGR